MLGVQTPPLPAPAAKAFELKSLFQEPASRFRIGKIELALGAYLDPGLIVESAAKALHPRLLPRSCPPCLSIFYADIKRQFS